jgi:N-acetylneuraminic acid mutarotase
MGVVFKARQISLNRIVAIKTVLGGLLTNETEMQRFRAEAQAAARLQHPNIVAIHAVGECNGLPYFSMDFIEGKSLTELARAGPLDGKRAAGYLKTIAEAISYAHQNGILHRDLKPSNVMIDRFDQPRVTDFGLAKRLGEDLELTLTGQMLGTPGFISPEQAGGRSDLVGPRSDIYSLGAILYFLLTARPPFAGKTLEETLSQVFHKEPVPPRQLNPAVPRDLETICLKCLEKEGLRRYAGADELAGELDRFARGETILARPVSPTAKSWRWVRRHPAVASMAISLAITLAALLAVVAVFTNDRGRMGSRLSLGPLASMPARSGNGISGVIGGKIYVTIPVIGEGSGVHDFYAFDPANNTWSHALDSSPVVHNTPAGGAIDGKFYMAGGLDDRDIPLNRLDIYDPASDKWSQGRSMPLPSAVAAGAVWDGKLYVLGAAADSGTVTNLVEIYDPRTDQWAFGPALPTPRQGAGSAVTDRTLYLVGGYAGDAVTSHPVAEFDALGTDGTWTNLAPLPNPVIYPFVAANDGVVYVAGGGGVHDDEAATLQAYSTKTGQWRMLKAMPAPRQHGCGAQWFNGELYVFGGWAHQPAPALPHDDVFVYNPALNSWRQ